MPFDCFHIATFYSANYVAASIMVFSGVCPSVSPYSEDLACCFAQSKPVPSIFEMLHAFEIRQLCDQLKINN